MNKLRFCVFQDIRQFAVQPFRPSNFLTGKSALSTISFLNDRQAFMLLFFEDGQVMFIAPAILSLRARKKRNSMFFKHHLTVTALADPHGRQTHCLCGGGGRMDGSAGVDRGHKAKMEGDAHRGSLKRYNTRGRRQRQSHLIFCVWCICTHLPC